MADKLTKEERETVIVFNEADNKFIIETSIAVHMRKFDRLGYECTKKQYYSDGTVMSKEYKVPKFAITFRKPEKRKVSEEQRQKAADRFKKMWDEKQKAEKG